MRRDARPPVRQHARKLGRALEQLGCLPEPAVLDLLFGAPAPPLTRLALALRAGRALSGQRGQPVTAYLAGDLDERVTSVGLREAIARLAPEPRVAVEGWVDAAERYAAEDGDRSLLDGLSEIGAHLALLPHQGILPPLPPAADAAGAGLVRALGAVKGNPQAQAALLDTYRFLGGRFTSDTTHAVDLPADPPPADRLGRWAWFCSHVAAAADRVDRLWRDLVDPPQ
jgi:hypothetical protein